MASLLAALVGVVVVLKTPDAAWPWPHTLPDVLALMGGFCFALTNVMLRRLSDAPPACSMLALFGGGALLAMAAALLGMQQNLVSALAPVALEWVSWVLALSLFFLVGNWGLQYGAARLSASATSTTMLSEVVFASGSALWLGAGQLTPRVVFGGACILAAALWSALPGWPRLGPADTPESEPVSGSASAPSAFELAPCLLFVRGLGHYRRHSAHALWSIKNRSMQCYWPSAIVRVHTQ